MELNEGLSEFVGAFIGDGCMTEYPRKDRPSTYQSIQFTGDWSKDFSYYQKIILSIILQNFNYAGRIYHRKDNTVRYFIKRKEVIRFLLGLGYKFGPKANSVFIPESILNNKSMSLACVRGIFNTDGGFYKRYSRKYKNHKKLYSNYNVAQIKSNSKKLLEQIKYILNRENINSNKIIKDKNAYVFRITNQNEIKKFVSKVGMNHEYHKRRINGPDGI